MTARPTLIVRPGRRLRARETVDEAIDRLKGEAKDRGIRVRQFGGRFFATSDVYPGREHFVTLVSCDCFCFQRMGRCVHHAALLALQETAAESPL